ncbi:MAG: putative PEP-binding protein [Oscillospiraceae bacterium]
MSSCPPRRRTSREIAERDGHLVEQLHNVIASLHEFNPMMGHRGCRLAVSYPEIAEMQTTAVINAAINVQQEAPRLEDGSRDHDPPGGRGQGARSSSRTWWWPPPTS